MKDSYSPLDRLLFAEFMGSSRSALPHELSGCERGCRCMENSSHFCPSPPLIIGPAGLGVSLRFRASAFMWVAAHGVQLCGSHHAAATAESMP